MQRHDIRYLSPAETAEALSLPDLSEDSSGHAVSLIKRSILEGLPALGWPEPETLSGPREALARDNYALLGYSPGEATLGETHTRWTAPGLLLRTQTTALVPPWLASLSPESLPRLAAAPGITYRRDVRDRTHSPTPHQMDLWVAMDRAKADRALLLRLVSDILSLALPGYPPSSLVLAESPHPYTEGGIEACLPAPWGEPLEILECGLIASSLAARLGLPPSVGGLALGMGLDRLAMLRKGIPDIRLLRHPDPRIRAQMLDLSAYRPVSMQPPARRDLSVACEPGLSEEYLAESARIALSDMAPLLETVRILGRWPESALPPAARERLGIRPGQENLLARVELRDHARSVPKGEAALAYSRILSAWHQGPPGSGYPL